MTAPISASVIPDSETSMRAVLMSMPNCDTRPHRRQYASVFAGTYTSSYRHPMCMRTLLIKRLDMTVSGDLDIISDNREKYAAQRVHAADLSQVSVAGKVVGWWTLRNS